MKRNSHPVKVVEVKDYEGLYANSHPFKVEIEGGGGGGETYSDFTGATDISAGDHGLVPAPKAGDNNKYLKGDGTWAEVESGESGIPTDATFWGQSYDATNNKVNGNIVLDNLATALPSIGVTAVGSSSTQRILAVTSKSGGGASARASDVFFGLVDSQIGLSVNATTLSVRGRDLSLDGNKIANLAGPTLGTDAANKQYVDTQVGNIETILQTLNSGTGAN